jgi:hypothetical protein
MKSSSSKLAFLICALLAQTAALTAGNDPNNPTWWDKYTYLAKNGVAGDGSTTGSITSGSNVDVSNECGPQSETFITLDTRNPKSLAAGSNEIFRFPMRGYYSSNSGKSWGAVDLPLPPTQGTNSINFGSDPTLAFDTKGNLFYGYIVVFFGNGSGVNGSEMAVARSTDGGKTYPSVTFFSYEGGSNHFNDKPMITADQNLTSQYRDNVYIAWDAAAGGSIGGGVRFATSRDNGANFTTVRVDDPKGPGHSIGASPAVGPDGEVYVAWNDYAANAIVFNRSFDGGVTFGNPVTISGKTLPFDYPVPAESFRGALVYPALGVDRSGGSHRGRLYASWMDLTAAGTTDIFLSYSDDRGASWSSPQPVTDHLSSKVDRFNHWLSVDPVTGYVTVSFYDTRNDRTGARYMTDTYLAVSKDGGQSWNAPDIRVSNASSNEHDCGGIFPCSGINYGNQQGDYEGVVSYDGVAYPVWTDSRRQLDPTAGCSRNLGMEEVFSARIVIP